MTGTNQNRLAILGFGASGLLTFFNLVKNYSKNSGAIAIDIFEKSPQQFARGIAYSTKNPNHLLNVVVQGMGAQEDRQDFFNWLQKHYPNYQKNDFVSRKIFGDYLQHLFNLTLALAAEKKISCHFFSQEITEIFYENHKFKIAGQAYDYCILATGTPLKNPEKNFWNIDITKHLSSPEIHLIGCGLTAFDAAISLHDLGFAGKIFMYSRTKKLPQMHEIFTQEKIFESPLSLADSSLPLSQIFKKFRENCQNSICWRKTFDAFRPLTQSFWSALSLEKKQRFMRHCFRVWNTHRHRCAQSEFALIKQMIDARKIILTTEKFDEKTAISCAGFSCDFASPLVKNLLNEKIVKLDEMAAGLVAQQENFYLMGGLNFGSLFEITSIPDIAPQARKVAGEIISKLVCSSKPPLKK